MAGGTRGIRRLAVGLAATAAAMLVWAVFAGVASAANGTLEICKAPDNGAAGQSFTFTVSKGTSSQSVTVTGGQCSAPVSLRAGNWMIAEDLSSGIWSMVGASVVPASSLVREIDRAGKVKVAVSAGAETQVTVVNDQASATIKVCKWSASPALQGAQYSFTVGAKTVTAVAGPNAAHAGCSAPIATQPGSRLKITEAVPANEQVAGITVSSNATVITQSGGFVKVTAGTGANIVTYDNEPVGPPQTGYIEVCKDAGDEFISWTDPFHFTITDHTGAATSVDVIAGQCTGPIEVAAGNVEVAEHQGGNTYVSAIWTAPDPNALGPHNLNNGTATVVVPVSGDTSGEVQVHFENSTITGTLKVCKYLTATSGALAGQEFYFDITTPGIKWGVEIIASASPSGACKMVSEGIERDSVWVDSGGNLLFPVGSQVSVFEEPMPYVGADGNAPGVGETKVVTIHQGINIVSFWNQAYGQIEICKYVPVPEDGDGENVPVQQGYDVTFHFSVDGSTTDVPVAPGRCSPPIVVPAGTHTVKESQTTPYGFEFVASAATGPTGDNRCVPPADNCGNPATVAVPWFADQTNGGETLVRFLNRVQRVQIKICKLIEPGSVTAIGQLPYLFSGGVTGVGVTVLFKATVAPPYPGPESCTGLLADAPVVDLNGDPTQVTVSEVGNGPFVISNAVVSNGTDVSMSGAYTVMWTPGAGVDVLTVTNKYVPQ